MLVPGVVPSPPWECAGPGLAFITFLNTLTQCTDDWEVAERTGRV